MARNGRANHAGRWTSRRSLSVPRMVLEFPNSRNQDRWWSARGHGTIHRFGRQGGRRESLPRGLVVVRSLAGRAARAIGLALGCNGSTRLHNGACKSAGPRSSGERPSYCLGRKWTRLPRLVANEFFRGRLSDPAFQTSEANLIEFIKARGRALDREQVSNGSLTHPAAISIPGNKQSPAASVLTGKGPEKGAVAGVVGIEVGVVSGVFNLESSGVEASDWRPRHDERYHEA